MKTATKKHKHAIVKIHGIDYIKQGSFLVLAYPVKNIYDSFHNYSRKQAS